MLHFLKGTSRSRLDNEPLLEEAVSSEEVIKTILLRQCAGIGFQEAGKKEEIMLRKQQFIFIRRKYEANSQAWLRAAKKRYVSLLAEIPGSLRPGLGKKDWFATYLKTGPPKITKKTSMARSIPAITGVYFYDLMG